MASVREFVVQDQNQLTQTINMYVAQGYVVAAREATNVTLVKRKQFSIVWAVVGFFLCLLPLLVYLVVYATQTDQMVFVRVAALPQAGLPTLSDDRRYWWDGVAWQDAAALPPPNAQRTADGTLWWDGVEWRPVRPAIGG